MLGRWMSLVCLLLVSAAGKVVNGKCQQQRPNIVIIVSDDQGYNDVGWTNPTVLTPNLDSLAYSGVILNQSYVPPLCSPSRAALMTGIYPFKTGMQVLVVRDGYAEYLPLKFKILPEYLKELNYSTHLVGKWHLGHCRVEATPTYRGFDSFTGCYAGAQDFYTKKTVYPFTEAPIAYDLRHNLDVLWSPSDEYTTDLYTKAAVKVISDHDVSSPFFLSLHYTAPHLPLQVPDKYVKMYPNITNQDRKRYLAMVTAMDEGVGDVVQALKDKGVMDNTIIIFTSDNGGMLGQGGASNAPLRGEKGQLFEGGTRVPAFITSPLLKAPRRVSNELFHVTDWLPTLLFAAGRRNLGNRVDGINQWSMLSKGRKGRRYQLVYNIKNGNGTLRFGRMKLSEPFGSLSLDFEDSDSGNAAERRSVRSILAPNMDPDLSEILGRFNLSLPLDLDPKDGYSYANGIIDLVLATTISVPPKPVCDCQLYDLDADPTESVDLSVQHPGLVSFLYAILATHKAREVEPVVKIPGTLVVASYDPKYNGTNSYGWC